MTTTTTAGADAVPMENDAGETVAASRDDAFVGATSGFVGGPLGRHAARRRFVVAPVIAVVAVTILTGVLAWLQKAPCLDAGRWQHEYQYTRGCYTDVFPLYWSEHLNQGDVPYRDSWIEDGQRRWVEYPVLMGATMYVAEKATHVVKPADRPQWFYTITSALLGACAMSLVVSVTRLSGRRPWDAMMVAAAPVMVVYGFYNWDLLAAAFGMAGLVAWSRRRPWLAGVLIGLGTATKLYPAFLLVALFALCLRVRAFREFGKLVGGAVLSWLVVNAPVFLLWPDGWKYFYTFNQQRLPEFDSLWYHLGHFTEKYARDSGGIGKALHDLTFPSLGPGQTPSALNTASSVMLLVLWALIVLAVLRAPYRPRVAQVAFLVVVAFLLVNKVWSPQYAIWYLPLGVLALPRWRIFLVWQLAEIAVFGAVMAFLIHLGQSSHGILDTQFYPVVWARDLVLLTMAGIVLRDMWHPERDAVRRVGQDDPAGGVLVEARA